MKGDRNRPHRRSNGELVTPFENGHLGSKADLSRGRLVTLWCVVLWCRESDRCFICCTISDSTLLQPHAPSELSAMSCSNGSADAGPSTTSGPDEQLLMPRKHGLSSGPETQNPPDSSFCPPQVKSRLLPECASNVVLPQAVSFVSVYPIANPVSSLLSMLDSQRSCTLLYG